MKGTAQQEGSITQSWLRTRSGRRGCPRAPHQGAAALAWHGRTTTATHSTRTRTSVPTGRDRAERSYGSSGTDLSGGQQGGPLGGGTHAPVEAGPAFRAIDLLE